MKPAEENKNQKNKYNPLDPPPHYQAILETIHRWQFAAKDAFKNVLEERGEVLPKPKRRFIEQIEDGSFLCKGKVVEFQDSDTLYAKVFRAVFNNQTPAGFAPYAVINKSIELEGAEKITDKTKAEKRIRNAIESIFRYSNNLLKNTPKGELVLDTKRGKGIILRNPEIG